MRVEWTALALADVEGLVDYLHEFGESAILKVVKPILEGTARLRALPNLGVESRDRVCPGLCVSVSFRVTSGFTG